MKRVAGCTLNYSEIKKGLSACGAKVQNTIGYKTNGAINVNHVIQEPPFVAVQIMESSKLSSMTWYRSIFLLSTTKKSLSCKEVQQ